MARPGRPARPAIDRVLRILLCLSDRGSAGVSGLELLKAADLGNNDSGKTQLRRDLTQLGEHGWKIENVGPEGDRARYVLHARDNRVEILLTPGERAALENAMRDRESMIPLPSPALAQLERAVERRCLVRMRYRDRPRVLHPYGLHSGPSGWVIRGRETDSTKIKEFVVSRIAGPVRLDEPGTAEHPVVVERHSFNPLSWNVDEPEEVRVVTTPEFADEVTAVLHGAEVVERSEGDVVINVRVTHRAAFRSRLLDLGVRVWLEGESENRNELLAVLRTAASSREGTG